MEVTVTTPADWKLVRLEHCLDLLTDFEANGSFEDVADNVKLYNSQNFAWYVRATDLENISPLSEVKYVDERTYKFLSKTKLFGGEVLITKRGDIGKIYLFQKRTPFATLAPNLYLLKLNDTVVPYYIYSFFKSDVGNRLLRNNNASSTLGALYKDDVKAIEIPLPPTKAEQTAIATALSDTDALITSLEKLVAKKCNIKQGAMQELLKPKKGWKVDELGNLASIETGNKNTQDKVEGGFFPFFVRSQTVERINTYSFDGEAILTAGDGVGTGKVFHYINGKFDFHQRVYKLSDFRSDINGYFLFIYFRNNFYNRIMQMTAKSSVDSVRMEMIAKMPIPYPDLTEQNTIATILTDMEREVTFLERKLDKYRLLKTGMMQSLLTGKIRLV